MEKVAAITGAYSGLGAALSRALAKRGWKLVLGGRNKKKLENFAKEIENITEAAAVVMDVRNKADCIRFVNAAKEKFGRLDLLVNNASIWNIAPIEDVTEEDVRDMFETNIYGPIFCAQAAVPIMKRQKSGHIVNIGSTAAVDFKTSHIAYGVSKAALINFTGALRNELEGTGVRVTAFSPGGMKTNLFRRKPERMKSDFMEPEFVAEKIMEYIEHPTEEWHVVLRRPKS